MEFQPPFKEVTLSGTELSSDSPDVHIDDPLIGSMLGKRLKILERLGAGGMSIVYKAEDVLLKRLVAVKVLHLHSALNPNSILRFRQEAISASKIDHENVVRIFEFNVPERGQPYLVMDFIQGESLADFITNNGPIQLKRAISLMSMICDGLQCAHSAGVIHRDLKPSNIMLLKDSFGKQTLKIVDFGIAKLLTDEEDSHPVTHTGEVFGSPFYMSPEQCWGKKLDGRSDVYSLACVMFEMCTGQPPIHGTNALQTIHMQTTEPPPSVGSIYSGIKSGARLDAVFAKAMAKDPAERFQSPADFKAALHGVLGPTLDEKLTGRWWATPQLDGEKIKIALIMATMFFICVVVVTRSLSSSSTQQGRDPAAHTPISQIKTSVDDTPPALPKLQVSAPRSNAASEKWRKFLSEQDPAATELDLKNLGASDENLKDLESFKNLRWVDLTGNPVSDRGMKSIAKLTNLTELRLSKTKVGDEGVRMLANLHLRQLRLHSETITNAALVHLEHMPLSYLLINSTKVDDDGAKSLAKLKDLEVLGARDTAISDKSIKALLQLKKLQRLDIQDTRITDKSLKALSSMKALNLIRVCGCKLSNQAITEFRKNSPDKVLVLQRNY